MKLTIARIGNHQTITFAFQELDKYLRRMDPLLFIEGRVYDRFDPSLEHVLWLGTVVSTEHIAGLGPGVFAEHNIGLERFASIEPSDWDEIGICVENGAGIITGSNERAVLIAAYRFLTELGCSFLSPGAAGEVVPMRRFCKQDFIMQLREKASYRHRSVCIEGAVGYEHVYNMIDWLPKVGMCGYFVQFHTPSVFFKRFYNDHDNPDVVTGPVTDEDITHIWKSLEGEVVKRSLDYHATGHGWTCEPFGIRGGTWNACEEELPAEVTQYLAEVNGERKLWGGVALNTNLCYSNPVVREKMTGAIVQYCKEHPAVNYLHFWLADSSNNHCECPACQEKLPSDYYVMLLNELDQKLTAAGIDTKIVCLIYLDLLWAPETEHIQNSDRFVLMFAPITRTYTNAFTDFDASEQVKLAPYVRNKLIMPRSVAENVTRLKMWQTDQLKGDSFDFDYHLMWDHYKDPGYYACARILHEDMANLDKIGLNGMVSCQIQRANFPTNLPMYAMAKALWDKESVFEDVAEEYFAAAFGKDGKAVEQYMAGLSELFDPVYCRGEKPFDSEDAVRRLTTAKERVRDFTAVFGDLREEKAHLSDAGEGVQAGVQSGTPTDAGAKSQSQDTFFWQLLKYHAKIVSAYADFAIACQGPEPTREKIQVALAKLKETVFSAEPYIHTAFDCTMFIRIVKGNMKVFVPVEMLI